MNLYVILLVWNLPPLKRETALDRSSTTTWWWEFFLYIYFYFLQDGVSEILPADMFDRNPELTRLNLKANSIGLTRGQWGLNVMIDIYIVTPSFTRKKRGEKLLLLLPIF